MSHYIRVGKLATLLGVSRATIYRWIHSNPNFPKPIKLGEKSTVFDSAEVQKFIDIQRAA